VWQQAKKDVVAVEKALKPHKEQSRHRVRDDLDVFSQKVKAFRTKFAERPFNFFNTGCVKAYGELNQANMDITGMEIEANRQKVLADLFDGDVEEALQIIKVSVPSE